MCGSNEKDNYKIRFLSDKKNERKLGQNISNSKFLKAINKVILLDTVTGVEIFFLV